MKPRHVAVIGAGVGGLVCALLLAARGMEVTVFERAEAAGGKMRPVGHAGLLFDSGPTVLTMRWVFDEILAEAGLSLDDCVTLERAQILARHAWSADERLDLFDDAERSEEAIGALAGPREAQGYRSFCSRAAQAYGVLERSYIRAIQPSVGAMVAGAGLGGIGALMKVNPFASLWDALGQHFADPRLRQLFGRYATYCGSSPFLAPATLMLIAHVEQQGVWLVQGGMHRLAAALAAAAQARGVAFVYGAEVAGIGVTAGRADSLRLADGRTQRFDAIVCNADAAALASGAFGAGVSRAAAPIDAAQRSLSAVTWTMVAEAEGFPLTRHNVFFSRDYAAEFRDILEHGRVPAEPTVYVCAEDRPGDDTGQTGGPQRLLCLVNAPASGDGRPLEPAEITKCSQAMSQVLSRCGLALSPAPGSTRVTTPADFHRMYPATGGALYGRASHGWKASFSRPTARSRIPGLYLAGGSVHPGAGVPMAALSGRMAALALTTDFASTARSHGTAISGGMSTR